MDPPNSDRDRPRHPTTPHGPETTADLTDRERRAREFTSIARSSTSSAQDGSKPAPQPTQDEIATASDGEKDNESKPDARKRQALSLEEEQNARAEEEERSRKEEEELARSLRAQREVLFRGLSRHAAPPNNDHSLDTIGSEYVAPSDEDNSEKSEDSVELVMKENARLKEVCDAAEWKASNADKERKEMYEKWLDAEERRGHSDKKLAEDKAVSDLLRSADFQQWFGDLLGNSQVQRRDVANFVVRNTCDASSISGGRISGTSKRAAYTG
ncbi:hypothetical protein FS837_008907 [Tulasnella sp. UAMH 9824]|nr:hypothetical protein FS837_008907 [Tulasnella sp. UAMH 9824]